MNSYTSGLILNYTCLIKLYWFPSLVNLLSSQKFNVYLSRVKMDKQHYITDFFIWKMKQLLGNSLG